MGNRSYIEQNMAQASTLDFLFPKDGGLPWHYDEERDTIVNHTIDVSLSDLITSNNQHYMVVAEPGYGKTRLLKEIIIQSQEDCQAFFIDAKKIQDFSIEESLKKCKKEELSCITEEKLQKLTMFKNTKNDFSSTDKTVVCIDALDEVAVSDLHELLEKIEEFIENHKAIKVFLSCRTHHLKNVSFNFDPELDFQFVALAQFSRDQIEQFLKHKSGETRSIDYHKSKISNLSDFISIPRYLYYFCELLEEGTVEEVISLSRSEMFEYFIYRKLNKELKEKTPQSQIDLLKRVLEKLAFIMKIDGVSEITKDELMTVFDKMDSNFSQIAFRDDLIQKLYNESLIKDNVETIEFENQEFLDYLSAKELARFEKVEQVFFDVAIEPHILELYTSWFYVLPFVFELKPSMIELFLNFLKKNSKQVFSSKYFKALLDIESESISKELKSEIFDMVFDYYTSHTKQFDHSISRKLSQYYDNSKYQKILDSIDGRKNKGNSLTVLRTNAVKLISSLIEDKRLDGETIKYWQKKVSKWLRDNIEEFRYLHQHILQEFANLSNGDFEWIKKHRFIFENGIQVQGEYARACFKVAPNDTFSIDVYLEIDKYWKKNKKEENLIRSNVEYVYILKLRTAESMKYALNKIWDNRSYLWFFNEYLEQEAFEKINADIFKENLLNICDNEPLVFLKELIAKSMNDISYHEMPCNKLYPILIEIILQKDTNYIKEFINTLIVRKEEADFIYLVDVFVYAIEEADLNPYLVDALVHAIEETKGKEIPDIIKRICRCVLNESDLEEKLRLEYPDLISKNTNKVSDYKTKQKEKACKDWAEKIEPEPNKFKTDLFKFFLNRKQDLMACSDYEKNYQSTIKIAKNVLKNHNPLLQGKVEKQKGGGATIWQVHYYEPCIEFVHKEKIELDQDTRDNVFRYLPFNINMDYETTLAVAKKPSQQAIQDIVDVYAGKRGDDLGIYHVRQFVELYNKMKSPQFEPVLLEMLQNDSIEEYERVYIAQSLPANVLTVDIIKKNKKELNEDSDLFREYLSILVGKHQDSNAIDEAFEWTKKQAETNDGFFDPMSDAKNTIAISMAHVDYDIQRDKEMLLLSSELSEKKHDNGSTFLTKVVESHLNYLIENKTDAHKIILDIEKFLNTNKDKKNLHWFKYALQNLKQSYLKRAKKSNIVNAIKKYNQLENEDYLPISSSFELRELVKDVIEKDIKRWIEDEGAYKHIQELSKKDTNTNAEDFIQKSIKSQIELALVKRGLRDSDFSIIREEQLLDDKRLDFTVRYGLIGSVMIELKLSHNNEAKPTTKAGKEYKAKLQKYMNGSNSDYGLFVIFHVKKEKNEFDTQIKGLHKLYEDEKGISVLGLKCV
ncbi:MAG: hypothetical protein LGB70_08755 [Sulfurovum sp.]|nr:hypothetical protein [Sulfurovum sp.]